MVGSPPTDDRSIQIIQNGAVAELFRNLGEGICVISGSNFERPGHRNISLYTAAFTDEAEIGRASCRERVCAIV